MTKSRGRWVAALLMILFILSAFPVNAQGVLDAQPPTIEFLTDETYKGLPVIYARDMREPAMSSAFYGFRVVDNLTEGFVDRTFVDKPARAGEGAYTILYDLESLSGFVAPAAAEVRVKATDAAGNEAAVQVWCVVRDMDAPYYVNHPENAPNERENRLNIELSGDDAVFCYEDFVTDALVEQTELACLHIDTLPQNGRLLITREDEVERALTKGELPYSLPLYEIRRARVRYAPTGSDAMGDGFLFRAEDALGNIAQMQTAVRLSLNTGYSPPVITDVPESADRRNKNAAPFSLDIEISDTDTPAIMLDVTAGPREGESRNAALTLSYISGNTWRLRVSPTLNMMGACTYDITAADAQGNTATAAYTLELVPPQSPVSAMDDGVQSGGNLHFDIDVLKNDRTYNGEALTIESITQPEKGLVEIRGDKVYYAFNSGVQADAVDSFTYTLSHDGRSRKGERLSAAVYINDTIAPIIGEVNTHVAQAPDWAEQANITVAIDEATALSSVAVREIKRNAASLEEASDTVLALEKASDGTYTGSIARSGQFILDVADVSGNRATKLLLIERVNGDPPVIRLDRKQLINGCVNGDSLPVEVESAVAIESALVKRTSGGQAEGLRLEETGRGRYKLYLGDESAQRLTLEFRDEMGHTASLNLGELRLDNTPPVIEVENGNEANAYYLPRYVSISDEGCGLAQASGLIMVEKGLYRTELSVDQTLEHHISASDRWGNSAGLSITMLELPDPTLMEADADLDALNHAIEEIEGELEGITDTLLLTGAERGRIEDILAVLGHQAGLAALYQSITEEGPDEAQTQAYLRMLEAGDAMTPQRRALMSATMKDALDDAFAMPAMAVMSARVQDTLAAFTQVIEEQEEPDEVLYALLEDTVMEGMATSSPEQVPESMDELVELYDAMHEYHNMLLSTDEGFLMGMLSRVDYSPIPTQAEEIMLYLDTQPADRRSAAPPEEGYHFVSAYDVSLRMRADGEASEPLELAPGKQALLGLQFDLDEDVYDIESVRLIRLEEGYTVEQEALKQFVSGEMGFLMTYASALGRFELYAKLNEMSAEPEPEPEPEPVPEPKTETAPEPAPTPEPEPTQAPAAVTPAPADTTAPTATPEGVSAPTPVSIPSWPLYIIGGVTLLIFLCWVVVTLRRRNG